MHQIRLRPATQTDAHFAFLVEEHAMRHHAEAIWGKWIPAEDPERYLREFNPLGQSIGVASNKDAGVLAYEIKDDCVYISKLYLLEKHRGAGLGAQHPHAAYAGSRIRKRHAQVKMRTVQLDLAR